MKVDNRHLFIIVTLGSIATCASTLTTAGKERYGESVTQDLKVSATGYRHHSAPNAWSKERRSRSEILPCVWKKPELFGENCEDYFHR